MNALSKNVPDAEASSSAWSELNRQWLVAAIAELHQRIDGTTGATHLPHDGFMPALLQCTQAFQLSIFEQELLLLLAGLELDQGLRDAVTALNDGQTSEASYGLAFSLLTDPHWDALSPDAPLRKFHLVEPLGAGHLTQASLHISERMLHFISGVAATEPALLGLARFVVPPTEEDDSQWAQPVASALQQERVVVLAGFETDRAARRDCALAVVRATESAAMWVTAGDLPADPQTLARIATIMEREVRLTGAIPVIDAHGEGREAAIRLALGLECTAIWLGPIEDMSLIRAHGKRVIRVELPKHSAARTGTLLAERWQQAAAPYLRKDAMVLEDLTRAAGQFHLTAAALDDVVAHALSAAPGQRGAEIWAAARGAARQGLDGLAQRIETRVSMDDVVLPSGQKSMLTDIINQLLQRERVYSDWGFGSSHQRGQGLVALFAGESGTGKTFAAEAIANAAELDLYRIDLATLISKYIGETEKNLKRLFDAADASGAVLLFDEADALFGKRSEVKDSHDRYANIEVSYLLQRVEAYRGLAILTSNMKGALDRAFLRRIRFVVNFPFPDQAARADIWRRQFPPQAPMGEVDVEGLARLNLPGGNIRNIAIAAAFKAAATNSLIGQGQLMAAAREEFAKLERTMGGLVDGMQ